MNYQSLQVILVDNGSTDGTVEAVHQHFPQVEIIENASNLGYAAGCNQALRRFLNSESDYALLLNNDTVVAPDMLDHLVEAALKHPDAGMLGPTIWHFDQPDHLWSAGQRCRPVTRSGQPPKGDPRGETLYQVDYLFGCGLLVKRRLLEQVGLFDERFFMYYEDQDLCLRAQAAGYRLLVVPAARMWHRVAGSTGEGSPLQKYYLARSSVLFFARHTPWPLIPLIVGYRLGVAVKQVVLAAQKCHWDVVLAYLRGLLDGLRLLRAGKPEQGLR